MPQKAEDLIWDKERQGIRITVFTKIGAFVMLLAMQLLFSRSLGETVFSLAIFIPLFILLALAVFLLQKNTRKGVRISGYISVALDLLLIILLPVIWFNSDATSGLPMVYILKSLLPVIMLFLIFLNALSINPVYPLILGIGGCLNLTVLLIMGILDPNVDISVDFIKTMQTSSVNLIIHISWTALVLMGGGILSFVAYRIRKTIIQSAELEVHNSQLSRYFSPKVADRITSNDEAFFKLGGVSQKVSVLFTDIRGFTTLSEELKPQEVMSLLSEYHEFMVAIIFKYGGTLDKFMGDGIMATFGTPLPSGDDSLRAVKAAIEMRTSLEKFNKEREARGLRTVKHGIGIHSGTAIAGNIGMSSRLEYTVIGDTVNTASRVETACKDLNEDILITESVLKDIDGNIEAFSKGSVSLKGKSRPVNLYAVG